MKAPTRRELLSGWGRLAAGTVLTGRLAGSTALAAGPPATRPATVPGSLPTAGPLAGTGPIDPAQKSVVVHIRRQEVIDGSRTHAALLVEMIEEAVQMVTGTGRADEAWNRLLKPDDRIAVKFNHVGEETLNTTFPMASALVESLKRAGFGPDRVMLVEAPPSSTRTLKTRPPVQGFSGPEVSFGSGAEELSAVLQEATAIINVPFLKTHNIAGMTGCLKNLSHALIRRPGRYHANGCAPFVGDIVALPQIRSKLRLHLMNALRAVYDGGPAAGADNTWTHAGLIVSTDPVAADAVGLEVINERRQASNLAPIGGSDALIPHLRAAAERGLGTDDPDYIRLIVPAPL